MARRAQVPLAITVLFAVLWLLWPDTAVTETHQTATPDASGPSPSKSHRARLQHTESDVPESEEPSIHVPNERITVVLRDASQGILLLPRRHRLQPSEYWPLPGDAPFPKGQTAAQLQQLMQQDLDADDPQISDWLDTALAEGLDPETLDADDPWAAVLGMEVARREADLNQRIDYQQALDDGLGPTNGQIRPDALVGPPDHSTLLTLAAALFQTQPEHPASEFARLYALEATVQLERPDDARVLALDMLHHTDDALVAAEAVHFLARLPGQAALTSDDLDAMARFHDDFPELMDNPDLLVMGLDQALRMDDGPRARDWAERYAAAVEHCEDIDGVGCAGHRDNLDAAVGYIGDRSPSQARDWRQGFELAGWACVRAGHSVPPSGLIGKGGWDDGWSWTSWEPANTSFGDCLQSEAAKAPEPTEPMSLTVAVIQ